MSNFPRKPDFEVRTPCGGPPGAPGVKWRTIGEAWMNHEEGFITARVDLPPQNNRIILVPFERDDRPAAPAKRPKKKTEREQSIEAAASKKPEGDYP